eukprot:CAMPEP_0201519168 /NCGR_PEP_ID=MMETSP0161_2-20130828/9791_1 /ASSEMBLY_ACC=CAM_ASM_000251 /TAXON_ID=180227 /ORGANISM="Neoparamoeba aestuarina, Strain SoJaBio B1-5/56/2" /LENGTH=207 /DNA_ID=CAMNT_0047917121 /DNA_START=69 /DNA_END=689 /DNA_ORIENTATION=+
MASVAFNCPVCNKELNLTPEKIDAHFDEHFSEEKDDASATKETVKPTPKKRKRAAPAKFEEENEPKRKRTTTRRGGGRGGGGGGQNRGRGGGSGGQGRGRGQAQQEGEVTGWRGLKILKTEKAKSARSSCKACSGAIAQGSDRYQVLDNSFFKKIDTGEGEGSSRGYIEMAGRDGKTIQVEKFFIHKGCYSLAEDLRKKKFEDDWAW